MIIRLTQHSSQLAAANDDFQPTAVEYSKASEQKYQMTNELVSDK